MEIKEFTVAEFIYELNRMLIPQKAIVVGEIGEKINSYPTFYFLKLLDQKNKSILNCFCWREKIGNFEIKPGTKVKILGYPKIHETNGELTFQIEQISFLEEGLLKKAFEALRKKLETEGFFKPERKKPVPRFCKQIGLITSREGEGAFLDFKKHLLDYGFDVRFFDVRVQGLLAIDDITGAIKWFNENAIDLDALVLIRGGGSWESLQAFNSEAVARAIFASKIPIICGVGHEKDVTIADMVADLRVSTPTDAAKMLSENWKFATVRIPEYEKNIFSAIRNIFQNVNDKLNWFQGNIKNNVAVLLRGIKDESKKSEESLIDNANRWIKKVNDSIKQQEDKLNLSNPTLKLVQGYSMTFNGMGKIIKSLGEVEIDQIIETKFCKGRIFSQVKTKEK